MNTTIVLAATTISAALVACRPSADYVEPAAERVEAARELSPGEDPLAAGGRQNRPVALVVRLSISGASVEVEDLKLRSLPGPPRSPEITAEHIVVEALDAQGETVGNVAVPDTRINIAEGEGMVEIGDRTISVAVPVTQRPGTLKISLPGIAPDAVTSIDVSDGVAAQCRQYPKIHFCQPSLGLVR